jgi:hypothetical protein
MHSSAGSPSADQENDARVASALSKAALAEAHVATAEADARAVKAEAEARAVKAEAEARAVKAEAEARAVKAEAEAGARAVKAEAEAGARAVKAEAEATARVATAEASARVAQVERQLEHERLLRQARGWRACACGLWQHTGHCSPNPLRGPARTQQVTDTHTLLAAEQCKVLDLKGERHLRGAVGAPFLVGLFETRQHVCLAQQSAPDVASSHRTLRAELVSERAAEQLLILGVRVGTGVQGRLNAALSRDAKLRSVLTLLAERHNETLSAVEHCLQNVYHGLSAAFHSTGGDVVIREAGFAVGAERCAVCSLLEAYDVPYTYYGPSGEELLQSPYALSPEERATAVAAAVAAADALAAAAAAADALAAAVAAADALTTTAAAADALAAAVAAADALAAEEPAIIAAP